MLLLPADIMALLRPVAPLFSRRVWRHVPVLDAGAILKAAYEGIRTGVTWISEVA